MCGIAGTAGVDAAAAHAAVTAMCEHMWARGPDDGGVDVLDGAVLGSRRLAIIDLSPGGHQPMHDPERGLTLVFNGMIYNFRELRAELEAEGERFVSNCDTEVVLRAYGRWGAACAVRLEGMFAFAVWDRRDRSLFLARDPMGIKPLYYRQDGSRLVFASQVKALLASGLVSRELAPDAIATYLAFGAISEPLTAIDGVVALGAGCSAFFRDGRLAVGAYVPDEPPAGERVTASPADDVRGELEEVVASHLVSDAPIGVFLSGGLDSSALAAIAARQTPHVRTVSVVFDDPALSEDRHMRRVAERIASDHVVVRLRPPDLLAWLDDAFAAMDQPTFDGINTFVVSRAASQSGLKVALSGLGADELFDGYGHLRRVVSLERLRRVPRPLAAVGAAVGRASGRPQALKAADWLSGIYAEGASHEVLRRLFAPPEVTQLLGRPEPALARPLVGEGDLARDVAWLDLSTYTRNVLLRDTDAMSMANSLEVRVPFLHRPLVDRMLALPATARTAPGKQLLASAVTDLLPAETLERRKHGFVLPLAAWMRGELRDVVSRVLQAPSAALLDAAAVAEVWDDFQRTGRRWHRAWSLYALARWAETV